MTDEKIIFTTVRANGIMTDDKHSHNYDYPYTCDKYNYNNYATIKLNEN